MVQISQEPFSIFRPFFLVSRNDDFLRQLLLNSLSALPIRLFGSLKLMISRFWKRLSAIVLLMIFRVIGGVLIMILAIKHHLAWMFSGFVPLVFYKLLVSESICWSVGYQTPCGGTLWLRVGMWRLTLTEGSQCVQQAFHPWAYAAHCRFSRFHLVCRRKMLIAAQ